MKQAVHAVNTFRSTSDLYKGWQFVDISKTHYMDIVHFNLMTLLVKIDGVFWLSTLQIGNNNKNSNIRKDGGYILHDFEIYLTINEGCFKQKLAIDMTLAQLLSYCGVN